MTEDEFDAELDEDEEEDDAMPEYRIWQRTDSMSNGRWLYVDHPDPTNRAISVGIDRVYTKWLYAAEARAMAAALIQAADELDALPPPPKPTFVHTTSGATVTHGARVVPGAPSVWRHTVTDGRTCQQDAA